MTLLAVLGAGIAGALARFVTEMTLERSRPTVPWGVFAVNIAGSGLLGLLVALHAAGRVSAGALAIAGTGFCGAFTTYSAFTLATVRLARIERRVALLVAAAMVAGCALAAAAGTAVAGVL